MAEDLKTTVAEPESNSDENNLSVNSIKQIVSTSNQYQCLKKIHGKGYKITEAFTKIFHPENDEEKIQTIIECIKNVPFYIPLINDYNEKVVPSIEGLQNRFIRDNKMKPHLAKAAAEIFIQNLKDFNLVEIPIRLKDSRMAYLSFPKDFTDDDLKKIFKVAKAYIEAYGDDIDLSDKKGAT